jgi:hypothetical protein
MLNMRARQQQQGQQGPNQQQQQQATAVQLLQQQQQQHQQQMFLQQALGFLRGSRQDLSTLVSGVLGSTLVRAKKCTLFHQQAGRTTPHLAAAYMHLGSRSEPRHDSEGRSVHTLRL